MASGKFKPGIPESFSLNVGPVQDLGDYLDEPPPSPRPQRRAPEAETPAPILKQEPVPAPRATPVFTPPVPAVAENRPDPAPRHAPVQPVAETAAEPEADAWKERAARPKAPRREISMSPETLRMSDELLDVIRGGSGQRDTKASELFHALVLLVHEAIGELEPHSIPKRGRWGSVTARAYPHELKQEFLRALLRKYAAGETTAGLRGPLDNVA